MLNHHLLPKLEMSNQKSYNPDAAGLVLWQGRLRQEEGKGIRFKVDGEEREDTNSPPSGVPLHSQRELGNREAFWVNSPAGPKTPNHKLTFSGKNMASWGREVNTDWEPGSEDNRADPQQISPTLDPGVAHLPTSQPRFWLSLTLLARGLGAADGNKIGQPSQEATGQPTGEGKPEKSKGRRNLDGEVTPKRTALSLLEKGRVLSQSPLSWHPIAPNLQSKSYDFIFYPLFCY